MVELDGKQYTVQTASENASSMIAFINNYCATHDVRNSKNEVIYIDAVPSNPLYMIIWGLGFLVTTIQNIVYSLGCAFSLANSSESQLLNLGDLAGVKRIQATRTTIDLLVYAAIDNACTIHVTDSMTVGQVVYNPAYDITIPANSARRVVMVANQDGAFNVSANTLTAFDEPIANIRQIVQHASIPGQQMESISSYRERLQRRTYKGTTIDRAQDAISSLEGVTMCNIYFNPSSTETSVVGDINVTPRNALLLVQGYNAKIAEAFFSNCFCNTTSGGVDRTIQQAYITHAGQQLICNIVAPIQTDAYIVVYCNQVLTSIVVRQMQDAILALAESLIAGQVLTSAMVLGTLKEFTQYEILGATVGTNAANQTYQITPRVDELFMLSADNINIDTTGAAQ